MSKTLFSDFDGTIVDSKALYYKVIYGQVKRFGFSYGQVDRFIDLGASLRGTLKKMGLGWFGSWIFEKKVMKEIKRHINEVKKCKDVGVLGVISGKKILISNSLKEFILPVLKHLKLKKCFAEIYGADDFSNKREFIKDYIKKRRLKKEECYYIGDRATDAEIARKSGCKSVIIASRCSWDSKSEILRAKPDFVIGGLKDLGAITARQR